MSSNIVDVFTPKKESQTIEDCFTCDVFNSAVLLGAGSYLLSGKAISKNEKMSLKEFNEKNPRWWRTSIRGFGALLLVYGIYRGTETYSSWRRQQERR